ncbi:MAG: DUF503 domain-containing protein [Bryobacterales bacterium]|nr:DUF503 domain-containing protein [Bryobacterales bacterium]
MPAIGVLTMELRIEHAHSLKEKRHVVKSLKERLRHHHNIAIAEIDYQDLWQSSLISAVTVSSSRQLAEQVLQAVERDAVKEVGSMLINTTLEWVE